MTKIARTYRIEPETDQRIKQMAALLGKSEAAVIDSLVQLKRDPVKIVVGEGVKELLETTAGAVVPRKALDAAGSHPEMPSTNVAEIQTALRANNLAVQRSGSNPYTRERQTRRAKK